MWNIHVHVYSSQTLQLLHCCWALLWSSNHFLSGKLHLEGATELKIVILAV